MFVQTTLAQVRASYSGCPVGTITLTPDGCQAFAYADEWLASGFSISPLSLPLERRLFVARPDPLDGVFGVFADSMPDGWGRLLVDRQLAAHGIDPGAVDSLTRLSIVGTQGMGALEYEPVSEIGTAFAGADFDTLAQECSELLATSRSDDLDTLFALGGSSGGARPKALLSIEGEEWIVKFPSSVDAPDIGEQEYRASLAARACGVDMPETRLFPSRLCSGYFGVRRFDRIGAGEAGRKVHMLSASAALETSHRTPNLDYDVLMRLTARLTGSAEHIERLFTLMCFNVYLGNRDDHGKNFSYLYDDERGTWGLSPAYDLTKAPGVYGQRATTVNGKGRRIADGDIMAVGAAAGLSRRAMSGHMRAVRTALRDVGLLEPDYA